MSNYRYAAAKALILRHASGRSYAVAAGAVTDVPESEAEQVDHASLGAARVARSGTTAQRPTVTGASGQQPVRLNEFYCDTTLGKVVLWNGSGWIDPMSGASA